MITHQKKVNADLTDSPDPAVLGQSLDKLLHLEVEPGNKADDQQIIQQDVDKDDGTNNSVGQVKTELKTIDHA